MAPLAQSVNIRNSSIEGTSAPDPASKSSDDTSSATPLKSITASLPWPEITKQLHPHRLSRTISDMMKEWEITDPDAEERVRRAEPVDAGHEQLQSP